MEYSKEKTIKDVVETVYKNLIEFKKDLEVFLNSEGVITDGMSYEEVLEAIKTLKIFKKNTAYVGFLTDKNGYIKKKVSITDLYEDNYPQDVEAGYYKLQNKVAVIDHERKRILEEV